GKGYVVLLRPADSPYRVADISLHGLDPDGVYTLTPLPGFSGDQRKGTGRELSASWSIALLSPGSSQVWRYAKQAR
ncbi:MAG: hypothetical protein ACP5XB_10745, partial [Isosphaeraceae bacterium]